MRRSDVRTGRDTGRVNRRTFSRQRVAGGGRKRPTYNPLVEVPPVGHVAPLAMAQSSRLDASAVLSLQRTAGNAAVAYVLQRSSCARSCGRTACQGSTTDPGTPHQEAGQSSTLQGLAAVPVQRAHDKCGCIGAKWHYCYDGCSVPDRVVRLLNKTQAFDKDNPTGASDTQFALRVPTLRGGRACDRHDECYQSCTSKKETCDLRMRQDMEDTCSAASNPTLRRRCSEWAAIYYKALSSSRGAQDAFNERKRQVCGCDPTSVAPQLQFPPRELLRQRSGRYLSWLEYQLVAGYVPLKAYKAFRSEEEFTKYLKSEFTSRPKAPSGELLDIRELLKLLKAF
jgi:hypothetical protein